MPKKPSNTPRCRRETGVEAMMPDVAGSLARVQRLRAPDGGHARLSQPETAPDQTDPGQKQQAKHDVAEISVAQRAIGSPAEPGAEYRRRHHQQYEPNHFHPDEARCRLPA